MSGMYSPALLRILFSAIPFFNTRDMGYKETHQLFSCFHSTVNPDLSCELEGHVFKVLTDRLKDTAIISVVHRESMNVYHDNVLNILGQK